MTASAQAPDLCQEHSVPLAQIATRNVISLPADHALGEAAAIMAARRISSILIADGPGHPIGIVTERNILRAMQTGLGPETPLKAVMSAPIVSVPETMACQEAYLLCLREGIRHLALVDSAGLLSGVASETDFRLHMNLNALAGRRSVASVMTRSVLSLPPETALQRAVDLMESHRDSCIVVVAEKRPVGIVTERDVVRLYVRAAGAAMPRLDQVMTAPILTVSIDTSVAEAASHMLDAKVRHLVVIDHAGELAGLIGEHDLTQTMALGLIDAKLDAERSFLRTLVDNLPALVWLKDQDGVYLACNPRFERFFGAREGEIVGKTDYDFVDVDLADFFRDHDRQAMADDGATVNEEWITYADDGHKELLETIKTPMRDATGRLIGVLGIGRDITAAHLAQLALKDSEERLRTLIDAIPDSVQFKDAEGRWLAYNQTAARAFGLEHLDCQGKTDAELARLAHPRHREALLRCRRTDLAAMTADGITRIEEAIPQPDGEILYFDVTKVPLHDAELKPKGLVILARDVTDSRHITQALQSSLQDFNQLVTRIPVGVFKFRTLAAGGYRFDYVSPRWCAMTGIAAEEVYGNAEAAFQRAHPDDLAGLFRDIETARQSGTPFDWEGRLRNGRETRWLHLAATPLPLPNGDIQWDGIQYDITERQRMAADIREKEQRYKQLFETANDGIFLQDETGFIDCNQRGAEMYGLAKTAIIGRSPADFCPERQPDGRLSSVVAAEKAQAAMAGEVQVFEWRPLRADGVAFDVEVTLNRIELGDTVCLQAIVRDIGRRKQAEAGLRLAASVFTNTHEGIVVTDAAARIVEVNEAFARITGYDRAEVLGKNPGLLKSGHHGREFYRAMWQALDKHGHWSGEIWNRRKDGVVYAQHITISAVRNELGATSHYVGVFADITPFKEHEQRLERIAHYDALTGVPNRVLLADRMNQAAAQTLRAGAMMAVCYLDLDGFKPVNDTWGHEAGDRLLVEMARRMKDCLRGGDTIARIGGDEFVLLLLGFNRMEECELALDRLLAAIARPVVVADHRIALSASLGVTLFPEDDADVDTLLRHADQAMYQAKGSGKNRYHLFDPEHERRIKAHRESQQRLAEALEQGEFELHYQPKVNMTSGEILGAEALIRWRHPERGLLLPGEFLPTIKGSDLEIAVGEWVIDTTLKQIGLWHGEALDIVVSVNIGADHLLQADFAQRMQTLLSRHPTVAPGRLELEILESTAIADTERAAQALSACNRLGIRFALDDFGTGFSSLTYFRRLPVDTLKIDQSFVRGMLEDPEDLGIVESVVQLAQAFNRSVIAEGVETHEHCAVLSRLHCHAGQGFGIARPMPPERLPDWIAHWRKQRKWQDYAQIPLPKKPKDMVLMTAIESHRLWVDGVAEALRNPDSATPPPLHSRQCRFGVWYHGSGAIRYGQVAEFADLEPLHEAIHALAVELNDLAERGRRIEALNRLNELYILRNDFIAGLEHLIESLGNP